MAMLSTHPAIVTIYQAGVAGDGRPYLVMEYCPRPNLQLRARKETFSVAEALRVGVQVAGAVETAHRAGVLHRDIKPANILVTAYNRPALTDFGIASTTGATSEASGMSIPWSPPESFAEPPRSGPRTDVWALGATLLHAARRPVAVRATGGAQLQRRPHRADRARRRSPSLDRPDAPESLQRVLERAMAKNPDDRYPSAVAFARALQKVQIELSHSVTPIDIVDDHPPAEDLDDDDDGLTRVREIVSIDPDAAALTRPSATTERKAVVAGGARRSALRSATAPPRPTRPPRSARRRHRPTPRRRRRTTARSSGRRRSSRRSRHPSPVPAEPAAATAAAPSRSGRACGSASPPPPRSWSSSGPSSASTSLVAGIDSTPEASRDRGAAGCGDSDFVPKVAELSGTRQGEQIVFTWVNRDPQEGDTFIWNVVDVSGAGRHAAVRGRRGPGAGELGHDLHRCDAAARRRASVRARPGVRRRMIWEIDEKQLRDRGGRCAGARRSRLRRGARSAARALRPARARRHDRRGDLADPAPPVPRSEPCRSC